MSRDSDAVAALLIGEVMRVSTVDQPGEVDLELVDVVGGALLLNHVTGGSAGGSLVIPWHAITRIIVRGPGHPAL